MIHVVVDVVVVDVAVAVAVGVVVFFFNQVCGVIAESHDSAE